MHKTQNPHMPACTCIHKRSFYILPRPIRIAWFPHIDRSCWFLKNDFVISKRSRCLTVFVCSRRADTIIHSDKLSLCTFVCAKLLSCSLHFSRQCWLCALLVVFHRGIRVFLGLTTWDKSSHGKHIPMHFHAKFCRVMHSCAKWCNARFHAIQHNAMWYVKPGVMQIHKNPTYLLLHCGKFQCLKDTPKKLIRWSQHFLWMVGSTICCWILQPSSRDLVC